MISRPATCDGCPLHITSIPGFCTDKIPVKVKFLIIAEAPGTSELERAEPMVGKAGFVLKEWGLKAVSALQIAVERGELGLSNVLRCLPKETNGRPYPVGEEKRLAEAHCRQYDKFPDTIHTVILAGEHSQRLYFREELEREDATDRALGRDHKGVMGRIGRVYEKDGKRWVFAPHPAFILRQPALVNHLQEALKIAVGQEPIIDPTVVDWNEAVNQI